MEDIKLLYKNKNITYYFSLIFLFIVILSAIILFFVNNYLKNEIISLEKSINSVESSIKELEMKKEIKIISLLELNNNVLDIYTKNSNIVKFIDNLNSLNNKYWIMFSEFSINNWEIKTNVTVLSDNIRWKAYKKAKNFIENYRNDESSLFTLWFINDFVWMDEISFDANFKIK